MELPSLGAVIAGKYQLESLLGVGGMGAVFRARHLLMNRAVALKWLRAEVVEHREAHERLLREAQSAARVRHPNVVQVFDVDSHQDVPFIVMELLEGESFADLMARGELTTQQVLRLLLGALEGLAAAHELGIVHRDIKPENIFVVKDRSNPEGFAKLLDFGVSKVETHDPQSARLTHAGTAVGTPVYMPVEQLTASSDVDVRADIYAFGVVLYHALTGVLPFDAETFAGVVLNIATTKPRALKQLRPELPGALDRVVMKAMARRREDRFPSAQALAEALRTVADSLSPPLPAYTSSLTPRLEHDSLHVLLRADRRRKVRLGLGVLLLAGLAVAAALWSRSAEPVRARSLAEPVPTGADPVPALTAPTVSPLPATSEVRASPKARSPEPAAAPQAPPARTSSRAPAVKRAVAPERRATRAPLRPPAPEATSLDLLPPGRPKKAPVGKSGSLSRDDF